MQSNESGELDTFCGLQWVEICMCLLHLVIYQPATAGPKGSKPRYGISKTQQQLLKLSYWYNLPGSFVLECGIFPRGICTNTLKELLCAMQSGLMRVFKSVRPPTSHVMKKSDPDGITTPVNRSFLMCSPERMEESSSMLSPIFQHKPSYNLYRLLRCRLSCSDQNNSDFVSVSHCRFVHLQTIVH